MKKNYSQDKDIYEECPPIPWENRKSTSLSGVNESSNKYIINTTEYKKFEKNFTIKSNF